MLPVVTIIGLQLGALLSGAVLTETVFNLSGVGRTMYEAITGRDYVVIQGFTLLIAIVLRPREPARGRLLRPPRPAGARPMSGATPVAGTPTATEPAAPLDPTPLAADTLATAKPASLWRDTLGSVLHQRSAVVGLTILTVMVLVALFAPIIAPSRPNDSLLGVESGVQKRSAPCIHLLGCPESQPQHLFGTDGNFRDVFSRVVYGGRVSLVIGFAAVGFAIVIGTFIGAIAGYFGSSTDNVLMRLMDVLLAFPSLLLAIAIVVALGGQSYFNALLAIASCRSPSTPASCARR